jgi:flagellar basal-body rod modification protein FlgD
MAIQSVGSSYTTTTTTETESTSTNKLGKDAFLQILISQLKYQDPMNPMEADEMLTQLSQLTQVELLTNLTTSVDSMTSSANEGKWISSIGKKIGVDTSTLSKGDEVSLVPNVDYDEITLTIKDLTTGEVTMKKFAKGDDLTYIYDGNNPATYEITATKDGNTVTCGSLAYKEVKGVYMTDTGTVLVFGNNETYDASLVQLIKG